MTILYGMLYIPKLTSIHTVITNSQRDNLISAQWHLLHRWCSVGSIHVMHRLCTFAPHLLPPEAWPLVSTWVVRSARCLTRWQDGEGDCLQVGSWSVRDWLWALPNPCSGTPGVLTSSNTGETCLSETSHRPTCPIVLWTSPQKNPIT